LGGKNICTCAPLYFPSPSIVRDRQILAIVLVKPLQRKICQTSLDAWHFVSKNNLKNRPQFRLRPDKDGPRPSSLESVLEKSPDPAFEHAIVNKAFRGTRLVSVTKTCQRYLHTTYIQNNAIYNKGSWKDSQLCPAYLTSPYLSPFFCNSLYSLLRI
jgi:hypothetical protein